MLLERDLRSQFHHPARRQLEIGRGRRGVPRHHREQRHAEPVESGGLFPHAVGFPAQEVSAFARREADRFRQELLEGRGNIRRFREAETQRVRRADVRPARLTGWGVAALLTLFLQLLLGAWVAGFRAGYVSNSWPDMGGHLVPAGIDWSHGALFAMTHDPYLLHFMHRWWAWVVVVVMVLFARQVRKAEGGRSASVAIHSTFGTQIILGILTVLSGIAIWLAVLHQATGALLVAATVWGAHELGRRR